MVEVIYSCKQGRYPFGRGKQNEHTYVEYLVRAKNESQVNKYRQLNSIFKKLSNPNIIHLEKVLKEDFSFHMIYEFHNKSLEQRLKQLENQEELANMFVELENVFDTLINEKLKAQLYLEFMGVDQKNHLKVWVKPDQLQFVGNTSDSEKKTRKNLVDYYQTQRTRIHLEIQEIFQTSELNNLKKNNKKRESQKDKYSANINLLSKGKTPNFVIEGNTLVFLNKSSDKAQSNPSQDNQQDHRDQHTMSKANHVIYEQRPVSKAQNLLKNSQSQPAEAPDLSKMSIAQKVLYYKKLKQNASQHSNSQDGHLIVKDSSTNNVSQNDLSKSSNNDSNLQIKTQMINKHRMKIITSQEVEVQGNSDDDLEKLARDKIAKINKEKHQRSKNYQNSTEIGTKANSSNHSGDVQKLLKGLDENSLEQQSHERYEQQSKQINSKIAQAKLKAKNILEKYGQKLKK